MNAAKVGIYSRRVSEGPFKYAETYHTDTGCLRYVVVVIDIDLVTLDSRVDPGISETFEDGRDYSARPTPFGPKVDDDGFATVDLEDPD